MNSDTIRQLSFILPDLILSANILLFLLVALFISKKYQKYIHLFSDLLIFLVTCSIVIQYQQLTSKPIEIFFGMLHINKTTCSLKIILTLATLVLGIWQKMTTKEPKDNEFIIFVWFILLGAFTLIQASHFMTLLLGLELMSLSSYIAVNYPFSKANAESSFKYFLNGALVSGLLVYGISFIYYFGKGFHFTETAFAQNLGFSGNELVFISLFLILSGLFFKAALFPFHGWAPDIYKNADNSLLAFLSIVPKLAAAFAIYNIFRSLSISPVIYLFLEKILTLISIGSIVFGSILAVYQKNVKRMLAYSSIAQSGIMIAAIISKNQQGVDALIFYALIALFMNYLVFFIIDIVYKNEIAELSNMNGLGKLNPFLSILLTIGLIAQTGLPPTAGFSAKLIIFSNLFGTIESTKSLLIIILTAITFISTLIALVFYLKPINHIFFKKEINNTAVIFPLKSKIFCVILVLPLIIGFFAFDKLVSLIHTLNGF